MTALPLLTAPNTRQHSEPPGSAPFLLVVDKLRDAAFAQPGHSVIEASDFLHRAPDFTASGPTIINLCRSYKYLSVGYYCSLLAEARGLQVLPTVKTINDLAHKNVYSLDTSTLEHSLNALLEQCGELPLPARFTLDICFGWTSYAPLAELARQVFATFPAPLLQLECEHADSWRIAAIRAHHLGGMPGREQEACAQALRRFELAPPLPAEPRPYRYQVAILHDPDEELPPSNAAALARFAAAGQELGIGVSLVQKPDYAHLREFDALFIRATTSINHHTYRFAKKAESEGVVVIDDPASILRCTNKVYLADLLHRNGIPAPRTYIVQAGDLADIAQLESEIGYPMVMKIPDGAFSRGVSKAENRQQFMQAAQSMLLQSSLILVQEYMYTEFDWRIGVLNRQAIFASKYYMSKGHWQVAKRNAQGKAEFGMAFAVALDDVPQDLLQIAVRAANLIGDGLYGVDMKMGPNGPVVIEINDNPNIDAGAEDLVLGDELYRIILRDLARRLDQLHRRGIAPRA